jgi:hypothetical protein
MSKSEMEINVVRITAPRRKCIVADVVVELAFPNGHTLTISDIHIRANKAGVMWMEWPSFPVVYGEWQSAVKCDRDLHTEIQSRVLDTYESAIRDAAVSK